MKRPEPWLRGTLRDVHFVQRALLHAFEQAREDILRWCDDLTADEMNSRPLELPSIGFQMRHISGSIDRLLTYADGRVLNDGQLRTLEDEKAPAASREALMADFDEALKGFEMRVRDSDPSALDSPRVVGRAQLPTTVGSLLVHCAEHTMRHVGQLITTVKVVRAMRR